MNEKLREKYIQNLDSIIESYLAISESKEVSVHIPAAEENELRDIGERTIRSHDMAYAFNIQAINAIWEICPEQSIYHQEATTIYQEELGRTYCDFKLFNILCKVRDDLKLGFIGKMSSLLHQEIFTDYLDMAQHLLDEGYKDAAAVIAGSTLESHLRQLCAANGIDTKTTKNGRKTPKKASVMNDDLKKKGVYSAYDHKMVIGQLDLRNNAAHGKYNQYTDDQVLRLIDWLKDFIDRNPA